MTIRMIQGEQVAIGAYLKRNREPIDDIGSWDIKAAVRKDEQGEVLFEPNTTIDGSGRFTIFLNDNYPVGSLVLAIRIAEPGGFIRTFNEKLIVEKDLDW